MSNNPDDAERTPPIAALPYAEKGSAFSPQAPWYEDLRQRRRQRREQDDYLHKLARAMRGESPYDAVPSLSRKQLSDLKKENESLRAELEAERAKRLDAERLLQQEKLNPAERAGIYRTLFASLVGGYGVRPEVDGALAAIPAQLVDDVASVGGSLDIETARKHARGALQQFCDDQRRR